jgi:chemotaxis protein methyltransferase CheR
MPLSILVINENEELCGLVSGTLEGDGHTLAFVPSGMGALKVVAEQKPDLVILEISTQRAAALEIKNRLERLDETRHLPVIVISDHPELEYELLKVFDFIPQPLDRQRLREDVALLRRGKKKRDPHNHGTPLGESDFRLFSEYLLAFSGLHFDRRNSKHLERGLANRMSALQIGSYLEYYDYLIQHRESRQELQKLLQFLTVGETYFFRYQSHFQALHRFLTTEVAPDKGRRLRLWSAGCSTGEEPYSMAMTIMEALPDWRERDIRIIATDINNRALKRARDGVYSPWALRATECRYLRRYFEQVGRSYLINEDVKGLVDFYHLNLQTDEFPVSDGKLHAFDAIFCRNVMIYFTLATTKRIVDRFADSLVNGGFLFLGHAETLAQVSTRYERFSHAEGFFYRKKAGAAPVARPEPKTTRERPRLSEQVQPRPAPPPPPEPGAEGEEEPGVEECFRRATALYNAEQFAEASQLVGRILRRDPEHTGALVMHGFILANNGHFEDALAVCDRVLGIDDLRPEAYFLRGVILDMLDRPTATEEYRKAILLQMDFVMPHYQLGRLYIRQGKFREGVRELRNSLKILERGGEESLVPYSGGLSREVFLDQLRQELTRVA